MREEIPQSFPQSNDTELVQEYVRSELEKKGIALQQFNIDGTVTTDKNVPDEIMSDLSQYASNKGFTIKFCS